MPSTDATSAPVRVERPDVTRRVDGAVQARTVGVHRQRVVDGARVNLEHGRLGCAEVPHEDRRGVGVRVVDITEQGERYGKEPTIAAVHGVLRGRLRRYAAQLAHLGLEGLSVVERDGTFGHSLLSAGHRVVAVVKDGELAAVGAELDIRPAVDAAQPV